VNEVTDNDTFRFETRAGIKPEITLSQVVRENLSFHILITLKYLSGLPEAIAICYYKLRE